MQVKVTPEHIKAGVRGCPRNCPVANAIKDAMGLRPVKLVSVGLCMKINGKFFPTPWDVLAFVRKFDVGDSVEPFEFVLNEEEGVSRAEETV